MHQRRRNRDGDWVDGPAGWAPILLLTLFATFGLLGAFSSPTINPDSGFTRSPVANLRIDVNTASQAMLQLLPRIGPKMAKRIIEDREANGPFEDSEDIQRVRGIGPRTAQRFAEVADFSIER